MTDRQTQFDVRRQRMLDAYAGDPAAIDRFEDDLAWAFDRIAEGDRYREALERVYQLGRGPHVAIARDALNAG